MNPEARPLRCAVIGAGMAGILSAIKLTEAGITDFTVYEKADRVGGTWRENTYPGLSCDVPSHLYSYSFALTSEWSRRFAPGPEIQAYFERVAEEHPAYSDEEQAELRARPERLVDLDQNLSDMFDLFANAVVDSESAELKLVEQACLANVENNVHDPELRQRLRPDYRAACKRLIISPNFYDAIQRPNAELVTDAIERIEPGGIRTKDGRLHELDVLVLATGFKTDAFMRPMTIAGRNGTTLEQAWTPRPEAYLSISIPDFPNFFMLNGPNGPVGNFSLIEVAELQTRYVMQLIERIRAGECREVCATREALV